MGSAFDTTILVFGVLLVAGALLSGLAHKSFLSLAALFVLVGFGLGSDGLDVLHFSTTSEFVADLAIVALIVILFRDGLEIEEQMLRNRWHMPFRKLTIAMPITCVLVAVAAKGLFADLGWVEAFLLGALLAPTDPILTSSIVTNPKVPSVIRGSLSLESGLNDGLALPAVLALTSALGAETGEGAFVWWQFVIQDIGLGVVYGLALGLLAIAILPRSDSMLAPLKALFGLGFAFAAYGLAHLGPHGNGLIAVFVCAITLGIARDDIRESVDTHTEILAEAIKLGVFVVFGSLLTLGGLFNEGILVTLLFIAFCFVVARPIAIVVSLIGSHEVDFPSKLFMGWFGPKGIATVAFSLFVLSSGIEEGRTLFNIAAVVVFFSVIVHGSTDTAGVRWISRHHPNPEEVEETVAIEKELIDNHTER